MLNPSFDIDQNESQKHKHLDDLNGTDYELKSSVKNESPSSSTFLLEDHCHTDILSKDTNKIVGYKLITVLILCILFMIGEIVGGILAKSISIQTDAAHMAADIAGFFFSILAIYVSKKESTRRMTFGYNRSEVIGALISILFIWILTAILVYLAARRIIDGNFEIEPIAMLVTASCGVLFNMIMFFILHTTKCFGGGEIKHHGHSHADNGHNHNQTHGHSHKHGHNHSHHHHSKQNSVSSIPDNLDKCETNPNSSCCKDLDEEKSDGSNINLRAAAIHVIGDFIQSVGVLVAAIIIYFKPEWKLADPICTFIFSVLVFSTTAPILRDIFMVLMEAFPVRLNYDSILSDLSGLKYVKNVHNLHVWCLTMEKYVLAVHLVIEKNIDTQTVLREANKLLRSKYKIDRTIIQVEYFVDGMKSCHDCQLPKS